MPSASHRIALNGVRGLAALSVLLFHLGRWLDHPFFAVNGGLSVDVGLGDNTIDSVRLEMVHVGPSFFAGILLCHFDHKFNSVPSALFYTLLGLMILIFFSYLELSFRQRMSWKLLLAPTLIVSESAIVLPNFLQNVSSLLCDILYPFYALYNRVLGWVNALCQTIVVSKNALVKGEIIFPVVIILSYAALQYYDAPVRRYLLSRARQCQVV